MRIHNHTLTSHQARLFCLTALVLLAALLVQRVAEASSEEGFFEIGFVGGGGFFQIAPPKDPPAAITFLYGSAFTGGGIALGANSVLRFQKHLGLQFDLLYSWASLTGFAEAAEFRREVSFGSHSLRMGVLMRLCHAFPNVVGGTGLELDLALGAELSLGLLATWEEQLVGFEPTEEAELAVETNLALLPVLQLGLGINLENLTIPVLLRFGINPFYPELTSERFRGFVDAEQPGAFTLDVSWYALAMAGVRFSL